MISQGAYFGILLIILVVVLVFSSISLGSKVFNSGWEFLSKVLTGALRVFVVTLFFGMARLRAIRARSEDSALAFLFPFGFEADFIDCASLAFF